jgi:hypothetical protein
VALQNFPWAEIGHGCPTDVFPDKRCSNENSQCIDRKGLLGLLVLESAAGGRQVRIGLDGSSNIG